MECFTVVLLVWSAIFFFIWMLAAPVSGMTHYIELPPTSEERRAEIKAQIKDLKRELKDL